MRTALFWAITQRVGVISYQRLGTTYRSLDLEPIFSPEMSVRNYHYLLRNNPELCSYHLLRGGSLKSRMTLTSSMKVLNFLP